MEGVVLERLIPVDPIAFIQDRVRRRRILWTHHVNMRLRNRSISRQAILDAVDTFELVEAYPADKYLPSFLVVARSATDACLPRVVRDRRYGR